MDEAAPVSDKSDSLVCLWVQRRVNIMVLFNEAGWVKVRGGFHLHTDINGIDIDRHWYSPVCAGCFCVLPWFRCEQFVTWLLTHQHVITCCLTAIWKVRSENLRQQLGTTSLIYGLPAEPLSVASLPYDAMWWATLHRSHHSGPRPGPCHESEFFSRSGICRTAQECPRPALTIPPVQVSDKAGYSGALGMRPSLPTIIGQIGLSAGCVRRWAWANIGTKTHLKI